MTSNRVIADPSQRDPHYPWLFPVWLCCYCANPFADRGGAHLDHIVPRAAGGPHERWNLIRCCARCNLIKGATVTFGFLHDVIDDRSQIYVGGTSEIFLRRVHATELAVSHRDWLAGAERVHQRICRAQDRCGYAASERFGWTWIEPLLRSKVDRLSRRQRWDEVLGLAEVG